MLTGAWLSWRIIAPPPQIEHATVFPEAIELPEFSLLDQDGNEFTRDRFRGQWDLLFFGFTHCPDVCPLTLQVLGDAQQQLRAEGKPQAPRIVLVSVDPERDTPERIGRYVAHFGSDSIGVTGSLDELKKLTTPLGIYFEKAAINGDEYSMDHSSAVLAIDPQGRFRAVFGAPLQAEMLVHDLPVLIDAL